MACLEVLHGEVKTEWVESGGRWGRGRERDRNIRRG